MAKHSERPEGLPPQAVWPPRVAFNADPVTTIDGSVVRAEAENGAPKGGTGAGVRVGKVAMPGDLPRAQLAEMPKDGPGVPRRAIPAPEEAGTTGTIPPPHVMTSDRSVKVDAPKVTTVTDAPKAQVRGEKAAARTGKGTARR